MIVDITGTILIPGNGGKNCPGNGLHKHPDGSTIECCCDECDYMLCCYECEGFDMQKESHPNFADGKPETGA